MTIPANMSAPGMYSKRRKSKEVFATFSVASYRTYNIYIYIYIYVYICVLEYVGVCLLGGRSAGTLWTRSHKKAQSWKHDNS